MLGDLCTTSVLLGFSSHSSHTGQFVIISANDYVNLDQTEELVSKHADFWNQRA